MLTSEREAGQSAANSISRSGVYIFYFGPEDPRDVHKQVSGGADDGETDLGLGDRRKIVTGSVDFGAGSWAISSKLNF